MSASPDLNIEANIIADEEEACRKYQPVTLPCPRWVKNSQPDIDIVTTIMWPIKNFVSNKMLTCYCR